MLETWESRDVHRSISKVDAGISVIRRWRAVCSGCKGIGVGARVKQDPATDFVPDRLCAEGQRLSPEVRRMADDAWIGDHLLLGRELNDEIQVGRPKGPVIGCVHEATELDLSRETGRQVRPDERNPVAVAGPAAEKTSVFDGLARRMRVSDRESSPVVR